MRTKYILIAILCLVGIHSGYSQSDKLFDKYAEMDNVTSVYISKAMFNMMPSVNDVGLNLINMKGKIESLQLVSSEQPDNIPKMRNDFSKLVNKEHEELMRVRDGKKRVTFYSNMKDDKVKDLLMLAESDSSFTVIQLLGNFTLQDIQDITKDMEK